MLLSRPLPDDMIVYARGDTHYLLYIFDVMKNQLLMRVGSTLDAEEARNAAARVEGCPSQARYDPLGG